MNFSGHRERYSTGLLLILFVLCSYGIVPLGRAAVRNQVRRPTSAEKRLRYDIKLAINFDERTYTGSEQVHWVNHGDHATSTIFFHLYANMRTPDYVAPTQKNDAGQIIADEPRHIIGRP